MKRCVNPYRKDLIESRKELRKNLTPAEAFLLGSILRQNNLMNKKFVKAAVLETYIVRFLFGIRQIDR